MKSQITIEDIKPTLNYSVREVCEVLGFKKTRYYELAQDGTIKYYLRKSDKKRRIKGTEVLKFYNS